MKSFALTMLVMLATGCQSGSETTNKTPSKDTPEVIPPSAFERDLDRICNEEEQSGALELQPGERGIHVAIWLAEQIESQEARELVAELSKLAPQERIARLQQELSKHNIAECEVINAWSGGAMKD